MDKLPFRHRRRNGKFSQGKQDGSLGNEWKYLVTEAIYAGPPGDWWLERHHREWREFFHRQELSPVCKDRHDTPCWEQVYQQYKDAVFWLCVEWTKSLPKRLRWHEPQDVFDVVFVHLYCKLPQYRAKADRTFQSWLVHVIQNLLVNIYRKLNVEFAFPFLPLAKEDLSCLDDDDLDVPSLQREELCQLEVSGESVNPVEENLIEKEGLRRSVRQGLIEVLPEIQYQVIEIKFFLEQSYEEFAKQVRMTRDAYDQNASRAYERLKKDPDE